MMMSDETTTAPDFVLQVEGLVFSYPGSTQAHERVVDIDQLELLAGQSLAILGPSGCGKTTLLHLLAGLLTPSTGRISILNRDIAQMNSSQLDRFRGQNVGMVFQKLFLMPGLSVRQNIALAQQMARKPKDEARVNELLDQLDLASVASQKPRTLSQGQAQRVAIARALVHNPALVLADEPTSALDDERAESVIALLKHCAESAGSSLVVVTHDNRVRGLLARELFMGTGQ